MPAVSVLMKPASGLCNLSCDYCFYCDEAEKRSQKSFGFMSLQTLKNVIRKTMLRAEGTAGYAFQGGEPSLRGLDFFRQAAAWQKQYNQNHVRVQNAFQTNGYLIDEEWCEFFREHQFLVGLSLDGTPEIHNSLRHDRKSGGATFDRISYSADLMDAYGVDYNILTVVTPAVAKNIADVYSYYKERGWNYQQYIACLDPLGEKHGQASHSLTPEVYGEFLIDLFFLWSRDLKNGKQPYIRQFENWIGLSAGYLAESCDQRGVCGIQNVVEAYIPATFICWTKTGWEISTKTGWMPSTPAEKRLVLWSAPGSLTANAASVNITGSAAAAASGTGISIRQPDFMKIISALHTGCFLTGIMGRLQRLENRSAKGKGNLFAAQIGYILWRIST